MVSLGSIKSETKVSTGPSWVIDQMPDLEGKVVIVTGGSSGVGREICKQLLLKNARVYMVDESQDHATAAIAEVAIETDGKYALLHHLDLTDLDTVNQSAELFLKKETSLHILFCIADAVCSTKDKYTVQGYDIQFGANTLGHLLFIRKLYRLLVSSTTPEHPARVIWASSSLHSRCTSPFNYEALRDTPARSQKFITPQTLYESSKFAIVQLGLYMSRTTFKGDGVVMIVVDHYVQVENSSSKNTAMKFFKKSPHPPKCGIITTYLYAGTYASSEPLELQGKYLIPPFKAGNPSPAAEDEMTQREMWNFCEKVIHGYLTRE
ncbi:NAD-P-binding protein [Thelephora ganbajun]|uniref:NAD-P-binding protein n=1 Tax=Thelephora ganbajun TaxID=370292 RepID=A0ACB6ZHU0_THEGA|nr:NAD-P-binding protein [Thelephora ganbajun]